jgi:hypothetical protein
MKQIVFSNFESQRLGFEKGLSRRLDSVRAISEPFDACSLPHSQRAISIPKSLENPFFPEPVLQIKNRSIFFLIVFPSNPGHHLQS